MNQNLQPLSLGEWEEEREAERNALLAVETQNSHEIANAWRKGKQRGSLKWPKIEGESKRERHKRLNNEAKLRAAQLKSTVNSHRKNNTPVTKEYIVENCTIDTETECWIWMRAVGKRGYGVIRTPLKPSASVHRVAWELWNGPIPKGLQVLHRCDVRKCCSVSHLFLGTQKDNVSDMLTKRRNNPKRKLSWQQAESIRSDSRSLTILAKEFAVSHSTIWKIKAGWLYKWKLEITSQAKDEKP